MTGTDRFGFLILVIGLVGIAAVLSNRLSARLRVPAPAFFLICASIAAELWPSATELPLGAVQRVVTIALALFSFVLTWVLAIPAGIYSATHPRSLGDHVLTVINYVGVATPNFMLALILMWVAFAYFDISVTGLYSPDYVNAPWSVGRVLDLLGHIWLPALVLGIAGTARLSRIMRANLLDELNKPYVVTARAKGMKEWALVLRYPVRLAFNPLVSTIGWYLPLLFSGSLIVATVMNLPNIGPFLLRALINQDMYLAGAILLIYCVLTVLGTLISDVLLAWLDPRIRVEDG